MELTIKENNKNVEEFNLLYNLVGYIIKNSFDKINK